MIYPVGVSKQKKSHDLRLLVSPHSTLVVCTMQHAKQLLGLRKDVKELVKGIRNCKGGNLICWMPFDLFRASFFVGNSSLAPLCHFVLFLLFVLFLMFFEPQQIEDMVALI